MASSEAAGNDSQPAGPECSATGSANAVSRQAAGNDSQPAGPECSATGSANAVSRQAAGNDSQPPSDNYSAGLRRGPSWHGFGECRMVLPELTVIDREDGAWVLAATRVGADGDEAAAEAALQRRLAAFEAEPLPAVGGPVDPAGRAAAPVECDRDDRYEALVSEAVAAIGRRAFHKVVLARTLTLDRGLDVVAVLDRLRQGNPACATFAFSVGETTFLGATPEELVTLDGSRLHTVALAGTAPRGDTPETDERLAAGLLASAKNRSRAPLRGAWHHRGADRSGSGGPRADRARTDASQPCPAPVHAHHRGSAAPTDRSERHGRAAGRRRVASHRSRRGRPHRRLPGVHRPP